MRNQTTTTKNRSQSTFLGNRRKSFFQKRTAKHTFAFLKINQGSVTSHKMPSGAYLCKFSSRITGRTAFSYGITFHGAYQNMIRLYNLKYSKS